MQIEKGKNTRGIDFGLIGETRAFDPVKAQETRTIPYVISTESKDRHGTVLNADGWDFSTYRGIVDFEHQADSFAAYWHDEPEKLVIGKSPTPIIENSRALADATFMARELNKRADNIFQMVLGGFLRSASIWFLPTEEGKWGEGEEAKGMRNQTYYIGKRELLSWGPVLYGSNVDAQPRSMGKDQKNRALDFALKMISVITPKEISIEDARKMKFNELFDLVEGEANQRKGVIGKTMEEAVAEQQRVINQHKYLYT